MQRGIRRRLCERVHRFVNMVAKFLRWSGNIAHVRVTVTVFPPTLSYAVSDVSKRSLNDCIGSDSVRSRLDLASRTRDHMNVVQLLGAVANVAVQLLVGEQDLKSDVLFRCLYETVRR